jgi:hypothetical protein
LHRNHPRIIVTVGTAIAIVVVSEVSGLFTLAIALAGVVVITVVDNFDGIVGAEAG